MSAKVESKYIESIVLCRLGFVYHYPLTAMRLQGHCHCPIGITRAATQLNILFLEDP